MNEILVVDDQRLVRWCICAKINAIEGIEVMQHWRGTAYRRGRLSAPETLWRCDIIAS